MTVSAACVGPGEEISKLFNRDSYNPASSDSTQGIKAEFIPELLIKQKPPLAQSEIKTDLFPAEL